MLLDFSEFTIKALEFACDKGVDLIISIFGTLLGFLTAIMLYSKQVEDVKKADKEAVIQRYAEHISWLIGILKQVVRYTKDQANEMDEFVKLLKAEPSQIHQLSIVANSSIQRLTRADNEATYHAYNTIFVTDPERDKHYGELLGIADYSDAIISQVLDKFKHYLSGQYERHLKIKDMLERSADQLATIQLSMKPKGEQSLFFGSEFYNEINRLLIENGNISARSSSFKDFQKFFVIPLRNYLLHHIQFPGVNDLLMLLKGINFAIADLEFQSKSFEAAFNPEKLRYVSSKLESVATRLEAGLPSV